MIVDPGDEARAAARRDRRARRRRSTAILLTHTHFDHVGAVAPVARATGAPVYCPEIEAPVLADIMSYVPWPGFGPFETYDAEHTLEGGERLELAGLRDRRPLHARATAPATSPTSIAGRAGALFSGDVLFQGSVGRIDLPGGDWPTLLELDRARCSTRFPTRRVVYPGHMGVTTLGARARHQPVPGRARAAW